MRRRLKAIFIGSVGNLVEWFDFYTYAAFALYFAGAFFSKRERRGAAARRGGVVRCGFPGAPNRRAGCSDILPTATDGVLH